MSASYKLLKIENYKGFDIMLYINGGHCAENTEYHSIFKNGEQFSILALSSPKAAKNVIDTYTRNNVNQIWR